MSIMTLDLVSAPFALAGTALLFVIGILAIFFLILIGMKLVNKASRKNKSDKEKQKELLNDENKEV